MAAWLMFEILFFYGQAMVWSVFAIFIYCAVHSPDFQYKYYMALRNYDNEEDDEFKNMYYS